MSIAGTLEVLVTRIRFLNGVRGDQVRSLLDPSAFVRSNIETIIVRLLSVVHICIRTKLDTSGLQIFP